MARTMPNRAEPPTVAELFANVRHNYFRLYFHYMYFNVVRYTATCRRTTSSPMLMLGPTIVAGKITLGGIEPDFNAFEQVRTSFQYLVNSWTTIVELLSIYKRLRAFEATIEGEPLPEIDSAYLERKKAGRGRKTAGVASGHWERRPGAASASICRQNTPRHGRPAVCFLGHAPSTPPKFR